jgi:glyoxylase-like metal-dependent hydrolase (beta-lactamase superfamily II)
MERPEVGEPVELESGVRLVLAPNPSPMTHWGTNTYILGESEVVVVDPGPDDPAHLAALLAATRGARVCAVAVTHAHLDHSPLAPHLARAVGAPVLGFGRPEAGRRPVMAALAADGLAGGGEGVDTMFRPDACLADGDAVPFGGTRLEVLHLPGHFAGHLGFALGDLVLVGDHVMGWASTLVSPPDGDVASFRSSTARLQSRGDRVLYPGHGAPLRDPHARLDWLAEHRQQRETAILEALGRGPSSIGQIARRVYSDVARALLPAAERNVLAHLVDLHERGLVDAAPRLSVSGRYARR